MGGLLGRLVLLPPRLDTLYLLAGGAVNDRNDAGDLEGALPGDAHAVLPRRVAGELHDTVENGRVHGGPPRVSRASTRARATS